MFVWACSKVPTKCEERQEEAGTARYWGASILTLSHVLELIHGCVGQQLFRPMSVTNLTHPVFESDLRSVLQLPTFRPVSLFHMLTLRASFLTSCCRKPSRLKRPARRWRFLRGTQRRSKRTVCPPTCSSTSVCAECAPQRVLTNRAVVHVAIKTVFGSPRGHRGGARSAGQGCWIV